MVRVLLLVLVVVVVLAVVYWVGFLSGYLVSVGYSEVSQHN